VISSEHDNGTSGLRIGSQPCECNHEPGPAKLIAVTGGPGAGKSALLELAARSFCSHVVILPEAATILFGGDFPRLSGVPARRAAQRSIFHVEREMERLAIEDGRFGTILCDRGTIDGIAYWPGEPADFWTDLETSREKELSRYQAVLHLETPRGHHGYNHANLVHVETAREAHEIDLKIKAVWEGHPARHFVPSMETFFEKAQRALELLRAQLPACCSRHPLTTGSR
jgi:predicted ATPase